MKTILIQHAQLNDRNGQPYIGKSKPVIRYVRAIPLDGAIVDHCGEHWTAKPCNNGQADYITVQEVYS